MRDNVPEIFKRYVLDAIDTLHFIALEQGEDSRTKIRACEVLLRYIADVAQFVDVLERVERIEDELGLAEEEEEEEGEEFKEEEEEDENECE